MRTPIRTTFAAMVLAISSMLLAVSSQGKEMEVCSHIVEYWRDAIQSACTDDLEVHEYLISRTEYEKHWFVEYAEGKMILRNTSNKNISEPANWIGSAACYLGTEHLPGNRERIFYHGGSAGTSETVSSLSFVEFDMDTMQFVDHVEFVFRGDCGGIGVDACYVDEESNSCKIGKAWLYELGS